MELAKWDLVHKRFYQNNNTNNKMNLLVIKTPQASLGLFLVALGNKASQIWFILRPWNNLEFIYRTWQKLFCTLIIWVNLINSRILEDILLDVKKFSRWLKGEGLGDLWRIEAYPNGLPQHYDITSSSVTWSNVTLLWDALSFPWKPCYFPWPPIKQRQRIGGCLGWPPYSKTYPIQVTSF